MLSPVLTCRSEVGLVGKKELIFTLEEDNISGKGVLLKGQPSIFTDRNVRNNVSVFSNDN